MDLKTDREQLIAEICHAQGLEEGIEIGSKIAYEVLKKIKQRGLVTLEQIETKKEGV